MYPTGIPGGGDPTDVIGRRIGAYLIDAVVLGILAFALFVALMLSAGQISLAEGDRREGCRVVESVFSDDFGGDDVELECDGKLVINTDDGVYILEPATIWLASISIAVLYFVVIQGLAGATLGKLFLGVRVVRSDGRPPGLGRAFLRWLILSISGFLLLIPELVAMLVASDHRRLGDKAAGTWVVRSSAAGHPVATTAGQVGPYAVPYGAAAPPPPLTGGPQWDAARNAYIQWDPQLGQWMQWSDGEQRWKPIDT